MELRSLFGALLIVTGASAGVLAQSTVNPSIPVIGSPVEQSGPALRQNFLAAFNDINALINTKNSSIGNNTAPIAVDGAQTVVQNSSTTAENILTPVTGGQVYDGQRSTVFIPPGSTILNADAFGCYIRSRSGTGSTFGNGVCSYGLVTAGASNTNVWYINGRLSDTEDNLGHSYTGVGLVGSEMDYFVTSAATTIEGHSVLYASNVNFAGGNAFQVTNTTPTFGRLSNSFVSGDAAASGSALIAGAMLASGTSVNSQSIKFNRFDSGGTEHAETLIDSSTGNLAWSGAAIVAATFLSTGAPFTVGAGQINFGGSTVAAGASTGGGTCPTGSVGGSTVQGCLLVNVAGTQRGIPFF